MDRRLFVASGAALAACAGRSAGADEFRSLFDGKTLGGWHKNPKPIGHGTGGRWQVEDGAIAGEQDPPGSGNGGILLTDETFADFELLIDMKPDWGCCSGLFVRSTDAGQCIQMTVDYHDAGNVGHLYGEGSGGWTVRPFTIDGRLEGGKLAALTSRPWPQFKKEDVVSTCTAAEFIKVWKIGDWNTARVRCVGKLPRVTTWINDLKVCDFDGAAYANAQYDPKNIPERGSIAVQVHGGGGWPNGARVRWKNVKIKTL
jgi:hypothetical protein